MIAVSPSNPHCQHRQTISFASTLYLKPVLDYILADLPEHAKADLHLGLQEALVNAAKHGNQLDPRKIVLVEFTRVSHDCWWVITDQGGGFTTPMQGCPLVPGDVLPTVKCECGRGLYILYRIFDDVYWNAVGNELRLHKNLNPGRALP